MSGPLYNTKPFCQSSDNGNFRLKMDLVPQTDPQTELARYIKQPVFSLEETHTGQVLWKRQYDWRQSFTKGLFVSDNGWSVLHLDRDKPRLHVITPAGDEVLIVGIYHALCKRPVRPVFWKGPWDVWSDKHVCISTTGTYWTMNAHIRFEQVGSQTFFICRTGWGRYLVLDLDGKRLVREAETSPELVALLRPADQRWALEILKQVIRERAALELAIQNADGVRLSPPEMRDLKDNLEIALQIVRQENVKEAAELLVVMQDFRGPVWERGVYPALEMNGGQWHYDPTRERIHLTLFAIGVRPRGLAFRWFGEVHGEAEVRFRELPECISDREQILKSLKPGMTFDAVIKRVGAPSAILGRSEFDDALPEEKEVLYERWDYDELGTDGKPVSWGLIWRGAWMSGFWPCGTKGADAGAPVLVAVKRIRWTKAYREMREGA